LCGIYTLEAEEKHNDDDICGKKPVEKRKGV
jgi:hypothetical protein